MKEIALVHGVHPSLIYDWRKKHGRKNRTQKARAVGLLPVTITNASVPQSDEAVLPRAIEIELPKGRVRIIGVDAGLLRTAMELLQ